MSTIKKGSLIQIQQIRAAVKAAATVKRTATDEARHIARQAAVEREVVGRSIKLAPGRGGRGSAPNFAVPAKRKHEYRSSTGLRSFHFGWSSVSKSSRPQGMPGTRAYENAAAAHIAYIEDGAIMRAGHTVYIDSSRVETEPNGERLVLSNISEHYEERVEFFRLVDRNERVNGGDKVDIDFRANGTLWRAIAADPDCDPAVIAAYDRFSARTNAQEKGPIALQGSGADLRGLMTKHGFVFANPLDNEDRLKRDGFCFHDGRGGRTEYRLVFELPREFNRAQRARALKLLCRRFREAGCMYVAVIHAPDAHNDQENYHIHLDFYDRKCRRLDGSERDLTNVAASWKDAIAAEMQAGLFRDQVRKGDWDFTVERTYQSNKKKRTHRPFAATQKSKVVRNINFVTKTREDFAKVINAIGRKDGVGDLYDPRDYASMGTNRPASKKLGSQKHGQETRGIATTIGIDNETAQTDFERRRIHQAYQDQCRHIDEIQLRWQRLSAKTPTELSTTRRAVDEELAMARQAAEMRLELDLLGLELERERSRARLVSERQGRASRTGSKAARACSSDLARQADDYLAKLDENDADLLNSTPTLEQFIAAHAAEHAATAVLQFEREVARLEAGRDSTFAADSAARGHRNIMVKRGALRSGLPLLDATKDQGMAEATTVPVYPVSKPTGTSGLASPPTTTATEPSAPEPAVADSIHDHSNDLRDAEPSLAGGGVVSGSSQTALGDTTPQIVGTPKDSPVSLMTENARTPPTVSDGGSVNRTPSDPLAPAQEAAVPEKPFPDRGGSNASLLVEKAEPQVGSASPMRKALAMELARKLAEGPDPKANAPLSDVRRAAIDNSDFEREMLVHVVRVERILLEFKDGQYIVPDHPRIPAAWQRHSQSLQVQLERDQRKIEGELQGLVKQIGAGRVSVKEPYTAFMMDKFGGTQELQQAKVLANQLAVQQSLAISRGIGLQ